MKSIDITFGAGIKGQSRDFKKVLNFATYSGSKDIGI